MLFMKEMRQTVIEECTLKESAAINQILGRRVSPSPLSNQPGPSPPPEPRSSALTQKERFFGFYYVCVWYNYDF
jgi:hypothetical protein